MCPKDTDALRRQSQMGCNLNPCCQHDKFSTLVTQNVPREDSDQNAQADLNLRWAHLPELSERTFSMVATKIMIHYFH